MPHGMLGRIWDDPVLTPRVPLYDQREAYKRALRNLNADVIKRFVAYATGGNGDERRAFKADELLLEALWDQVQMGMGANLEYGVHQRGALDLHDPSYAVIAKRSAPSSEPSSADAPPAAFQTPWAFFMEYAANHFNKALVDGWLLFRDDANAYHFHDRGSAYDLANPYASQNAIVEHPRYWLPLARYVNMVYAQQRGNAAYRHNTAFQTMNAYFQHAADRVEIRKQLVELGLRRPDRPAAGPQSKRPRSAFEIAASAHYR